MLKFIGTGDLANSSLGNTCAYLKKDKDLLLIDCGVTAFARMLQLNIFDGIKNVYIAITHMHPDHVGSLASIVFYLNYWKNIVPNILIGEDEDSTQEEDIETFLTVQGVGIDNYEFMVASQVEMKDVNLCFKRVEHSKTLTSYAVVLQTSENNIYYLGDNNDKNYLKEIIKNINSNDIVYTDCTILNLKNQVHMHLNTLKEVVPEKMRKQVYCMHFVSDDEIEEIKQAGFSIARNDQSKQEYLKLIKNR